MEIKKKWFISYKLTAFPKFSTAVRFIVANGLPNNQTKKRITVVTGHTNLDILLYIFTKNKSNLVLHI